MTNLKLILPPRHKQVTKPGYKEVIIPAPEARVPISIVTEAFIPKFCKPASRSWLSTKYKAKFCHCFRKQCQCTDLCPTGAGKMNIALLAILRLLVKNLMAKFI